MQAIVLQPQLDNELEGILPIIASNLADVETTCYDAFGRMQHSISDIALQDVTGMASIQSIPLCFNASLTSNDYDVPSLHDFKRGCMIQSCQSYRWDRSKAEKCQASHAYQQAWNFWTKTKTCYMETSE